MLREVARTWRVCNLKPETKEVLDAPDVRPYAKAIIRTAFIHDPVDALNDIELALKVIEKEVDGLQALGDVYGTTKV